jgi:hypothetical protein
MAEETEAISCKSPLAKSSSRQPPEGVDPKQWREQRKANRVAGRLKGIAKGQATLQMKRKQQALVREKVEQGLPITEEERELLWWSTSRSIKKKQEEMINKVAALVIKPQTIDELRAVIDRTAAKYQYNPIEALIKLGGDGSELPEKEKVQIHKALLPFFAPALPPATKMAKRDKDDGKRVKVTVTQFVFPELRNVTPLHQERPATVVDAQEAVP